MAVNKLTYPAKENAVQEKINEIIDNLGSTGANTDLSNLSATGEAHFQAPLVSGTNIKTINSTSLLGSGNIAALQNTATGTNALTILGTATNQRGATNIGSSSSITGSNTSTTISEYSIAIGQGSSVSDKAFSIAIGGSVQPEILGGIGAEYKSIAIGGNTTKDKAIQLGYGTNSIANSFFVGLGNNNYQLLDGTTGLIPDARISSNIARTSDIPSISNLADKDLGNLSATGQAVIDGKADTDLSNITATGKEVITGADKPDYANYSSNYVTNTEYTASTDMWVEFTSNVGVGANYLVSGSGVASALGYINTAVVYENQVGVSWDGGGNTVANHQIINQMYRLYKGNTFRLNTTISGGGYITSAQIYTYPIAS